MTELLGLLTGYVPKTGTKLNVSCRAMEARPPTPVCEGPDESNGATQG
jgi:hypothetical protein